MAGGKSTPKHEKRIKVSGGEPVKTGQILVRGLSTYKAGQNVRGLATLYALCEGKIYFTRKKTGHNKTRTVINILPRKKTAKT